MVTVWRKGAWIELTPEDAQATSHLANWKPKWETFVGSWFAYRVRHPHLFLYPYWLHRIIHWPYYYLEFYSRVFDFKMRMKAPYHRLRFEYQDYMRRPFIP